MKASREPQEQNPPQEGQGEPQSAPQEDPKDSAPVQEAAPEGGAQESPDSDTEEAVEQVQEVVDQEVEQGFRGTEVDTTPNENYTVEGVGSDPTAVPEAAEFKSEAALEATNPDIRARH